MFSFEKVIKGHVSNLLGSPASGEQSVTVSSKEEATFPIYWVPQRVGSYKVLETKKVNTRVSNLLGSPASGELGGTIMSLLVQLFPIYWVPQRVGRGFENQPRDRLPVSNLLGSPASGESTSPRGEAGLGVYVSNLLGSPASGETMYEKTICVEGHEVFPIYWVPQRVGSLQFGGGGLGLFSFQFIGFPSEWGGCPICSG